MFYTKTSYFNGDDIMNQFDWKSALNRANIKGKFSETAKQAVSSWPFCGIGERYNLATYITEISGETGFVSANTREWRQAYDFVITHEDAHILGMDFMNAVMGDDIVRAKELYKLIQDLPDYPLPGISI